ncbi:MAG: glycosyltransferase family 2 protein [Silvibacterium sp.]|nr:glycosyltransferase family 2 protein [Silvibacterium sp.]
MPDLANLGITASVPYFNSRAYVRRAVECLLAQTHRKLTVVVVCDGDPCPPWPELAHIRDPRLIRFTLARNYGPYFAHQVVLGASESPYFLVHDADDWSPPARVSTLLRALIEDGSDLAFSAWQQYRADSDGYLQPDSIRWRRRMPGEPAVAAPGGRELFLFDPLLDENFVNRASHHGVFRREALQRIGGYYAGFRMNYDTLLTNFLLMTGRISFIEEPLYQYVIRRDSLSHSPSTGARSSIRIMTRHQLAAMYREALEHYRAWMRGESSSVELNGRIRMLVGRFVTPELRQALQVETARLAAVLRARPAMIPT